MTTNTTYAIDAYLSTQSDDSDPDPIFRMTADNIDDLESSLCEMIRDDVDNVRDVVLTFKRDDDQPNVALYDIVATRYDNEQNVIGVAYIETTAPARTIRDDTLQSMHTLCDDMNELCDDIYDEFNESQIEQMQTAYDIMRAVYSQLAHDHDARARCLPDDSVRCCPSASSPSNV